MGKVGIVAFAEVVKSRLAVGSSGKAVFGAFAVAEFEPFALEALLWQLGMFVVAELELPLAEHHGEEWCGAYVAEAVFGEYKVVASIDVAVPFHGSRMSACPCKEAYTRGHTYPAGECRVKELNEYLSYVMFDPLVEDVDVELPKLFGRHAPWCKLCTLFVGCL